MGKKNKTIIQYVLINSIAMIFATLAIGQKNETVKVVTPQ